MGEFDCIMTVSSTKSSIDSGIDNEFLSDSSSSSSKSDCCPTAQPAKCVFEEKIKGKRHTKHSYHQCALSEYRSSGRCLETLSPKTFLYLANCVRVLDLSKNKIKSLPETLGELQHLEELNLSCNELSSVPESCKRLQKLQVLNLSRNQLTETPRCLELGMERLTQLDLSENMIIKCPNPPKCLPLLQILNLSRNCLNLLPLWLFSEQCRSITELDVSFNYCFDDPSLRSQLPFLKHHRTSALKILRKLRICNTGINPGIVSPLSSFESLESLHMGNFPSSEQSFNSLLELKVNLFYNPDNLVELHLPKIGLAGLPDDIYRFTNLEVLDASQNQLDWLPETFGSLKSLRQLVVSDCNLSYLPANFSQLKRLRKLVLDHNKLTDIRNSISGLSSLEWLDVYNNYLEELPVSADHLRNLHKADFACNYINLELLLDVEVDGEKLFDVYCRQETRLREANKSHQPRNVGIKVNSNTHSWDSLESLYKSYRSDSHSDLSQSEDNKQSCNFNEVEDFAEENWDEFTTDVGDDFFHPESVYRFHLPLGLYHFGWTPPVKRKECPVPLDQQARGFVFIPGQSHQKTTMKKRRKRVKDLPVVEGQFEDAHQVDEIADLQKAESLGEMLTKMCMFVRNPAGLRCKRRCKFHSAYEDCLHHGFWFRLSPPLTVESPYSFEDDTDI